MTKTFAEGRERTEEGWLKYPLDRGLRRAMYSEELADLIMTHPAKQNAHLHRDICEFVSEPGDTILDPFGGVGTSLLSATLGRNVVLIEVEEYYIGIIRRCIGELESKPDADSFGRMMVVAGDNRLAMPIPCDHIITSPPYGNDLFKDADKALNEAIGKQVEQYGKSNQNIGKLNPFVYQQAMNKVYELMVKGLRPGGTITITHRDRMRDGERILYIDGIIGTLRKLGLRVHNLEKWKAPGSIQSRVNEAMGAEVILDEDIITMRKE